MKRLLELILFVLGGISVVLGIRFFQKDPPPKPTEEDQVTRVDYLSGQYQDALEDREQSIRSQQKQGGWIGGAGLSLLLTGLFLLFRPETNGTSSTESTSD